MRVSDEEKRRLVHAVNSNSGLADLLEANGISKEAFIAGKRRKHLEMFMFNYPRMDGLQFFDTLVSLSIMQQSIEVIENLECCTRLEKLWLAENRIRAISGLGTLTQLQELYLYSNEISRIQGLENLQKLQVLWVNDNEISDLKGLERCVSLRVLWAAKNKIRFIGDSLFANSQLEELNLACNLIGNFKEIPKLQRLTQLKAISFDDPLYGDNPVCKLSNYQTFTLYHVPQITSLDFVPIGDESRHIADATFVKKKMYYNMRIKTMKRNATNVLRSAQKHRADLFSTIGRNLDILLREFEGLCRDALKDGETDSSATTRYMELIEGLVSPDNPSPLSAPALAIPSGVDLSTHSGILLSGIRDRYRQMRQIDVSLDVLKDHLSQVSDMNANRLMVELESGGNVRIEEGRSQDVWFHSCADLVRSRFFSADFSAYGISSISVTRVCRVHNRYLRNRFESRLEMVADVTDSSYKKSLEYLFIGQSQMPADGLNGAASDPERTYAGFVQGPEPYDLLKLCEDGFVDSSEPFTRLSNSVSLVDIPRIQHMFHAAGKQYLSGCLLIAKVFLGKFSEMDSAVREADIRAPPASATAGKHTVLSLFKLASPESKQKFWYVFDNSLVLPEYLVFFQYSKDGAGAGTSPSFAGAPASPSSRDASPAAGSSGTAFPEFSVDWNQFQVPVLGEFDGIDLRTFAPSFDSFLKRCREAVADAGSMELDRLCQKYLSSGPRPSIPSPAEEVLLADPSFAARWRTAAGSIFYLNLSEALVKKIDGFEALSRIKVLNLSFNEISRMDQVQNMPSLEVLDLSFNVIKRIEGLGNMPRLKYLFLSNNYIFRLEDVNVLKRNVPDVEGLSLASNAITESKNYRSIILRRLIKLQFFDGLPVTESERVSVGERTSGISLDLLPVYGRLRGPLGWSLLGRVESPHSFLPQNVDLLANPDPSLLELVQILEIPHMRIRKISCLEVLVNCRKLNLSDNEIAKMEGLENLRNLQELNLEDNKIPKMEGLEQCLHIRRLELGKNKIQKIENLSGLKELTLLSLEDNEISSLNGVQTVSSLMELYVSNNRIDSLKEVNFMKELPKLIILDMTGNAGLCAEPEYRLMTIFLLRKLKVLDGLSIDTNESGRAKELLSGRLTSDFLSEKLGHANFSSLQELDLSNSGLRDLSLLEQSAASFSSLRELNLESNALFDLTPLCRLRTLTVLRLARNRLEASAATHSAGRCTLGRTFETLPGLEVLDLSFNMISHLPALCLSRCTRLRSLNLTGNEIAKVEGLENLGQLRELCLDKNKVRLIDPSSFMGLQSLRELRMEENALRSLDNFRLLTRLQALFLSCNRVMELADIDKLADLRCLLEIVLVFNPVARKVNYRAHLLRRIPSLQMIDGREVTYDERERSDALAMQEYGGVVSASLMTTNVGGPLPPGAAGLLGVPSMTLMTASSVGIVAGPGSSAVVHGMAAGSLSAGSAASVSSSMASAAAAASASGSMASGSSGGSTGMTVLSVGGSNVGIGSSLQVTGKVPVKVASLNFEYEGTPGASIPTLGLGFASHGAGAVGTGAAAASSFRAAAAAAAQHHASQSFGSLGATGSIAGVGQGRLQRGGSSAEMNGKPSSSSGRTVIKGRTTSTGAASRVYGPDSSHLMSASRRR